MNDFLIRYLYKFPSSLSFMSELTEEQRKQWEEKIKKMSPEELQQLQKQQCVFCQIVAEKVPSKKVYEDSTCLAILDINPAAKGHLLLLPKEHYAIMPQVPEQVLKHVSIVTKYLSQILLKVTRADGTTIFIANGAAAGQRAQHFFIHLIPRKAGDVVIPAEERLVGLETAVKVKTTVEKKLLILLGGRKEIQKEEVRTQLLPELEMFVTSGSAKRYHTNKCPFAQNIPPEKKVTLLKEEAEKSGRKPCTCVSGKRIPLVKPIPGSKPKKKKEPLLKKISESKQSIILKKKNGREASLDDIANLFK